MPCYFESQPQGCLKPHCPFFHQKPRPNGLPPSGNVGPLPNMNQPQLVNQVNPRPTGPVPSIGMPIPPTVPPMSSMPSTVNQGGMKIPTISSPLRPRLSMLQRGIMVRPPVTAEYAPVGVQPRLVPQPPPMIRTPQYTGPPRPGGMVQPVPGGSGFPQMMPSAPARYGPREIPVPQQSYHNTIMYAGGPQGSTVPFAQGMIPYEEKRRGGSYDKQDSDSFSGSDIEEERNRSHHANRRKVVGGSRREVFASKKKELHKNKRLKSNKSIPERDRSLERKKMVGSRAKGRGSAEAARDRIKARRKPSRKSSEFEEVDIKDVKPESKGSSSKDDMKIEKTAQEEKASNSEDLASPDIKVKTLEEILREKALKKLEERRAQSQDAKTEEKDSKDNKIEDDENAKKVHKEEGIGAGESENSEKSPVKKVVTERTKKVTAVKSSKKLIPMQIVPSTNTAGKDDTVDNLSGKTASRKVLSNKKNWPLKKVVSTVRRDNGASSSATSTGDPGSSSTKDNNKDGDGTKREPPSPFQQVKVKSFEEIMELKRKRRAKKEGLKECLESVDDDPAADNLEPANDSTVLALSPTKRLKRVNKVTDDNEKEGKVVSSSNADSGAKRVPTTRKRTVFVMEKQSSPSKKTTDNDVTSTATTEVSKPVNSTKKSTVGDSLPAEKVKVKTFDEIMAEKRQRASQNKEENQQDEKQEKPKGTRLLKNKRNESAKPTTVIKPRRIKVWAQGPTKSKSKDDSVSSSSSSSISKATLEVRAAPGDNSDLPDTTALTSSTVHFDPTGAEGVRSLVCESSTEQVSTTEQNHDSCQNTDDIPGINSGPRLDEDEKDNLKTEDSTDDGIDSSENVTDTGQPVEQSVMDPPRSKEPPSYNEIKQAIASEMAKKDDFFGDFDAEIDLGHDDVDLDVHSDVNEDDLLMELDEMINQ